MAHTTLLEISCTGSFFVDFDDGIVNILLKSALYISYCISKLEI